MIDLHASALAHLEHVAPPPPDPSTPSWTDVERALGTALPSAYKSLVNRYGFGVFVGSFQVLMPDVGGDGELAAENAEAGARIDDAFDDDLIPFPAHPRPHGLFKWASADDGTSYYWRTDGDPDDWPVVRDGGEMDYDEIDRSTLDVVLAVVQEQPGFEHADDSFGAPVFQSRPVEATREFRPDGLHHLATTTSDGDWGELELTPFAGSAAGRRDRLDAMLRWLAHEHPDVAALVVGTPKVKRTTIVIETRGGDASPDRVMDALRHHRRSRPDVCSPG